MKKIRAFVSKIKTLFHFSKDGKKKKKKKISPLCPASGNPANFKDHNRWKLVLMKALHLSLSNSKIGFKPELKLQTNVKYSYCPNITFWCNRYTSIAEHWRKGKIPLQQFMLM